MERNRYLSNPARSCERHWDRNPALKLLGILGVHRAAEHSRTQRTRTCFLPWFAQEDPDQERGSSFRSSFRRSAGIHGMRRRGFGMDAVVDPRVRTGVQPKPKGGPNRQAIVFRFLSGRKRMLGGEARHIASVRAIFLGSHPSRNPPLNYK